LTVTAATFPTKTDGSDGPRITSNSTFLNMQMEGAGAVTIEGIVAINSDNEDWGFMAVTVSTGFTYTLRRCIIKAWSIPLYTNDAQITAEMYNNFIYEVHYIIWPMAMTNGFFSKNTIYDTRSNTIDSDGNAVILENNLVYDANVANFINVSNATGNNNQCYDATCEDADFSSGANNQASKTTDPFTAVGSSDFTLAAASNPIEKGKDLSGSFTDDFFGTTRSVPWDIGAHEYSAGNSIPTISSLTALPEPFSNGDDINFSVDWNDDDSEGVKLFVCATDAMTTSTPACTGTAWCSNSDDYDSTDPLICSYTATSTGGFAYYAFICDDEVECATSSSGSFTVHATGSNPFILDSGTIQLEGGTMIIE